MTDLKRTGRIGGKIFFSYVATTIIAVFLGLLMAFIIGPGRGFSMAGVNVAAVTSDKAVPTLGDLLISIVPRNIFQSLSSMNLLQIIFFAIFLGVALVLIGEKKGKVTDVFGALADALTKMISIILELVPIGVFALMAVTGAKYGLDALMSIGKVVLTDYICFLIQTFVVLGGILIVVAKVNPLTFYRRCGEVIMTAISTTSSAATLPLTIRTATQKLGISPEVANFTLPLGCTVNLNGAAVNIAVCVVFSAQVFGIDFSFTDLLSLVLVSCIAAIGAPGLPGGAIVFTLAILGQFNIPTEAYAMIIAVYRIIDMGMTPLNILGDLVCTAAVTQTEKILDRTAWDGPNVAEHELDEDL
jgi:Na+/H+-dicarboxylate symporter